MPMYTLELGLYPLAAIVVGALLTLIFFGVVRLKCAARWAIATPVKRMLPAIPSR